jgi:hypothetical protein
MKDQVMEMFAQGYVVVVDSYYGIKTVESAKEITDVFKETKDYKYVDIAVNVDREAHRVKLFVSCNE